MVHVPSVGSVGLKFMKFRTPQHKTSKIFNFYSIFRKLRKKSNSLFQIFGNPRYERFVHTEIVNPSAPPTHTHTPDCLDPTSVVILIVLEAHMIIYENFLR